MDERTVFDDLAMWPVMIRLGINVSGYSLWANKGSDEVLLAICGYIPLFISVHSLRSFVIRSSACNLSDTAAYSRLREILLDDTDATLLTTGPCYDVHKVMGILTSRSWEHWDLETCSLVLGTLNMFWDMARTSGEQSIVDHMRGDAEVKAFLEFLTFVGADNITELDRFNRREIADVLGRDLVSMEKRVLVVC
jgi:hypothetical protein